MPALSVFAGATEIGLDEDATQFQPHGIKDREPWSEADIEPPVTVHQHRLFPIQNETSPLRDEHGYLGSILAGCKDLARLIGIAGKLDGGCLEDAACTGGDVEAENRRWLGKAGKGKERFGVASLAAKSAGRSEAG